MKHTLIALALAAPLAHAEFLSGNMLYDRLNGNTSDQMLAMGYIAGVYDAGQGVLHCGPSNLTLGQITDMVKITIRDQPQNRHFSADAFVTVTVKNQWPCKKGNNT